MLINCKQQNYYYFTKMDRKKRSSFMDLRCLCGAFSDCPGIDFKREEPARWKLNRSYKILSGWWDGTVPRLQDCSPYIHIRGFGFAQPTPSPTLFLFKDKKLLKNSLLPVLEEFDEPSLEKWEFKRQRIRGLKWQWDNIMNKGKGLLKQTQRTDRREEELWKGIEKMFWW